jgi:hypothetical protein
MVRAFSRAADSEDTSDPGLSASPIRKRTTLRSLNSSWRARNSSRPPVIAIKGSHPGAMPRGRSSSRLALTSTMRPMFSARST